MTEEQKFQDILSASTMKENSKGVYRSFYNRLIRLTDGESISHFSQERLIKLIDSDIPPKSQESLVSVAIMIRNDIGASTDKLYHFRDVKLRRNRKQYQNKMNIALKADLPSKATLESYADNLFDEKDYVGFVVNILALDYGVRNKDVNVIITRNNDVSKPKHKSSVNYLVILKKYVTYVRNDYKTVETYGKQIIRQRRGKFIQAVNHILGDNYEMPLLLLNSGEPISESSVGSVVQNYTYKNIGEGKMFKSLIYHYKKEGNIKRIQELSKTRGTSLDTIMSEYDITA